ncbi:MAG: RnfABCDGE type electron transport complex subunit D [Scytonema sp. PMC 1069.18]|nr:RnfABCDGE type electron transport complex subunit D [Scytonema sp. PMC 1069.18]MEC4880262.1 RnfABCDGE type electron transport complex subunit D [Scytonema sp. PMC 1070.18]
MLFNDIRDYQILFLALFLFLGIGTRDWTLHPENLFVAIATCVTTQWVFSSQYYSNKRKLETNKQKLETRFLQETGFLKPPLRSALITSLGLSLLLRADSWTTMALASGCAIASKFMFKVGDKHFFNPANFGIISALVLTPDAWVSPGQWGEDWWYGLLFAGCGGMILKRVGRWDTTAAFLLTYAGLEAIRNFWLGWTWDVFSHRLMSGSLLLFALFMITDPRSIPNSQIGRIVWSACIAILTFILRNYFYVSTAVFWSLFALSPLTILIDSLWSAPHFSWSYQAPSNQQSAISNQQSAISN